MLMQAALPRHAMPWDFHDLFYRHAKDIARSLCRRGVSPEDAADLTQDAFLRVLAAPPAQGVANNNPKAYLYRVSHNLTTNYQRRSRLLVTVDIDDEGTPQIVDPLADPERQTYARQMLSKTAAALDELPERTRKAFEMHRLGGQTVAEIGDELEISTTRAWALVRDAYRHLLLKVGDV
jgi:RNA polymerase sigma-70 factor (ECF subfamily)